MMALILVDAAGSGLSSKSSGGREGVIERCIYIYMYTPIKKYIHMQRYRYKCTYL